MEPVRSLGPRAAPMRPAKVVNGGPDMQAMLKPGHRQRNRTGEEPHDQQRHRIGERAVSSHDRTGLQPLEQLADRDHRGASGRAVLIISGPKAPRCSASVSARKYGQMIDELGEENSDVH